MGIGMGRRTRYDNPPTTPYVKPEIPLFTVRKSVYFNNHTILKVWYKNAKNCGGNKILVFDRLVSNLDDFEAADPHFQKEGGPIARFHPSQMGWSHALLFVEQL